MMICFLRPLESASSGIAKKGRGVFWALITDAPASGWGREGECDGEVRLAAPVDMGRLGELICMRRQAGRPIRVLSVDDDPDIREKLSSYLDLLKSPAYEVETAENGLEGYRRFQRFRPDVVVLDLKMPVRNGSELYPLLNQSAVPTRVIVLSATLSADELVTFRRLGQRIFVDKEGSESALPSLKTLIEKLVAFS